MNRLHDKTVLVVDGGHGLGRAAALAFAHEGARVVVGEREVAAGEETVTAIVGAGGRAELVVLNPLLPASCERAVQRAVEVFGTLDVLCSRVATAPARRQLLHETSEEEWDAVFAECVTAAVLPTRSALRVMRENGGGSIIVIGSS